MKNYQVVVMVPVEHRIMAVDTEMAGLHAQSICLGVKPTTSHLDGAKLPGYVLSVIEEVPDGGTTTKATEPNFAEGEFIFLESPDFDVPA